MNTKNIKILTDSNFQKEITESDKPVFVDFWSSYCEPCKKQMTVVEEIAEKYSDKYKVCKIEVSDNPETPAKLQIMSIPALAIFREGKLTRLKLGFQNKQNLKKMLDTHIHSS